MNEIVVLLIILLVLIIGFINNVNCFESFIEGVKIGTNSVIKMFPSLFTFMVAICFLNSSGLLNYISDKLNFKYALILLEMLIRPLSSSSAMSILLEIYNTNGVDSFIGILSTMIYYVSDATLYIVPFYCGMFNIKNYNSIIKMGLIINVFSYVISFLIVVLFYSILIL